MTYEEERLLMFVLDAEVKKQICGIPIRIQTLIVQSVANHFTN